MRTAERRRAWLGVAVVVTSLGASPDVAMAQAPADDAAAPVHDAAFRSGLDQYGRGNYMAAIGTWESLLGTMGEERGYKVLYNLGLAYQAVGDVTRALERYRAFVAQVARREPAPPDLAAKAEDARTRAAQIEQTYGAVHVKAPRGGGIVLTRVGTSEPRAAGYVLYLAPGAHTIELFAGTDHAKKIAVQVERGTTVDVETSAPDDTTPKPATPPPRATEPAPAPPPDARSSSTWLYLGAATVASLALPITLFFVADGKRDDAEALGAGHTQYADASASFERWQNFYYVSYALPVVLAGFTVGAFLTRSTSASEPLRAAGATVPRLVVGPGSASVVGRF